MLEFGIYAEGRLHFSTICIEFCATRFQNEGLQTMASFLKRRGMRWIFHFFRSVRGSSVAGYFGARRISIRRLTTQEQCLTGAA